MRLGLLVAPLVAITAAVLAPGALAASTPHPGPDGCDHSKPPACRHGQADVHEARAPC